MKTVEEKANKYAEETILALYSDSELMQDFVQKQKKYAKVDFIAGYNEDQANPKIKQLEWDVLYSSRYVKDTNPIGYRAKISEWHINTTKYVLSFAHSGEINAKIYDTLEEAMMYAQKDFESRIKECLTTE